MAHSKQSKRWLQEHSADPYVKRAQKEGYRSRAVYKLLEIQEKDAIVQPGMTVVDLGAAPGSWSQLLVRLVGKRGRVIALDRLSMPAIAGVEFFQADFTEMEAIDNLLNLTGEHQVDLVVSDMAPNTSGIESVDQPKAMYLAELALDFAKHVLKMDGNLLIKVFHGVGFDELLKTMRKSFKKVVIRKPKASRSRSKEAYLVAKGYTL